MAFKKTIYVREDDSEFYNSLDEIQEMTLSDDRKEETVAEYQLVSTKKYEVTLVPAVERKLKEKSK